MQKFTRPLTREITLAGERLALTFSEEGIAARPVGSRKPPRTLSWAALLCQLASPAAEPGADQLAAAVQTLKTGSRPTPPATPAPDTRAESPLAPAAPPLPQPGADVPALLGRLEHWFAAHRHHYHQGLKAAAGTADLDSLQNALGMTLPDGLRQLLAWRNGQDDETTGRFRESWFLMRTDEIAAAWRRLTSDAASGWDRAWVPFLDDDRGNYVFVDTGRPGGPVREYREQGPERPELAPSLAAWLEEFVTTVERGEYVEDPERGLFLHRRSS